jgi:hypothetical protein
LEVSQIPNKVPILMIGPDDSYPKLFYPFVNEIFSISEDDFSSRFIDGNIETGFVTLLQFTMRHFLYFEGIYIFHSNSKE